MKYIFEKRCKNCQNVMHIMVTDDFIPGYKERATAYCPKCHAEVFSKMISGSVIIYEENGIERLSERTLDHVLI